MIWRMPWTSAALVLGFASVMGCGDSNSSSVVPDACSALAAGPSCKAHGLANIDLSGTWTMTGTATDTGCMPAMPTTMPTSFAVKFDLAACTVSINGASGQIDDTIAMASSTSSQGSSSVQVCVDATSGLLTYSSSQTIRCIPTNPTPDTRGVEGTLQR